MEIVTGDIIMFYPAECGIEHVSEWLRRKVQSVTMEGTPVVTVYGELHRIKRSAISKVKHGRKYWQEYNGGNK